jgi:CRP-like cAMP-binding protein
MRKVLYIFGLLTDTDIEWMARNGTTRRLQGGEVIIREGVSSKSVIFVLEGELAVTSEASGQVARLSVGEIVGEISLVDSAPPSATVTASRDGAALFIDKTTLLEKLGTDEGFGCRFYRALAIFLADRLRATVQLPSERSGGSDDILRDELDINVLDHVSAAGERFRRLLDMLRAE